MRVEVGDQHCHLKSGGQEVGELSDCGEMANMHLTRRRVPDVYGRRSVGQQRLELILGHHFVGMSRDQRFPVGQLHMCCLAA